MVSRLLRCGVKYQVSPYIICDRSCRLPRHGRIGPPSLRREFSKQECNNIQDATPKQPVKHTCVSDQTRARATLHSRSWPLGSCRALEFTYCTQHLPTVIGGSATLPAPTYSRCIRNRERGCCPRRWMRSVVCFYSFMCFSVFHSSKCSSPGYI